MGHESEQVTKRRYRTMSDDRRFEVLESLGNPNLGNGLQLKDEQKVAIVDKVLVRFSNE